MSDKVHCDLCDAVIPPDVERLTLKVGIARHDAFHENEVAHDICPACCETDDLLGSLMREFKAARRAPKS